METTVNLRLFRHKGVVYMLNRMTQRVYCYNPEQPVHVGTWDRENHTVRFLDGALDALRSGNIDTVRSLHEDKKSSGSE